MSTELNSVVVDLLLDIEKIDSQLNEVEKRSEKTARVVDKLFANTKLRVDVDHNPLKELNKHIELKRTHVKNVQAYLASNPLKVNTDGRELVKLCEEVKAIQATVKEFRTSNSRPVSISVDDRQVRATQERLDRLRRSGGSVNIKASASYQSGSTNYASDIKEAVKEGVKEGYREATKGSLLRSIVSAPLRAAVGGLSSVAGSVATGFLEEGGASFARSTISRPMRNAGKKAVQYAEAISDYVIGTEDILAAIAGELIHSGDPRKAVAAAKNTQTALAKTMKRFADMSALFTTPADGYLDKLETSHPHLAKQVRAKLKGDGGAKDVAQAVQAVSNDLKPTDFIDNLVNPVLADIAGITRFIAKIQAYRTGQLATERADSIGATFPNLDEGQTGYMNIIGGAMFAGGNGGRRIATALEPLFPDRKLIPVDNPDTDRPWAGGQQKPSKNEQMVLSLLQRIAPGIGNSSDFQNTIQNVANQIIAAFDPTFVSEAAVGAVANVIAAKNKGVSEDNISTVTYSLGGAEGVRTATTLNQMGMSDSPVVSMAYPFMDIAKLNNPNYSSSLLTADPLSFPLKLGVGGKKNEEMKTYDALSTSGYEAHAYKHLFRSAEFVATLFNKVGAVLPPVVKGLDKLIHSSSGLYELLGSYEQATSLLNTGEFNENSAFKGFINKEDATGSEVFTKVAENAADFQKSKSTVTTPQAKEMINRVNELINPLIAQIAARLRAAGATIAEDIDAANLHGYLKYQDKAPEYNQAVEAFKTGTVDDDKSKGWFAGELKPEVVADRIRAYDESIKYYSKGSLGEYGKQLATAFTNLKAVALEFAKTGKISQETLATLEYLQTEILDDSFKQLSGKTIKPFDLPGQEDFRVSYPQAEGGGVDEQSLLMQLIGDYRKVPVSTDTAPQPTVVETNLGEILQRPLVQTRQAVLETVDAFERVNEVINRTTEPLSPDAIRPVWDGNVAPSKPKDSTTSLEELSTKAIAHRDQLAEAKKVKGSNPSMSLDMAEKSYRELGLLQGQLAKRKDQLPEGAEKTIDGGTVANIEKSITASVKKAQDLIESLTQFSGDAVEQLASLLATGSTTEADADKALELVKRIEKQFSDNNKSLSSVHAFVKKAAIAAQKEMGANARIVLTKTKDVFNSPKSDINTSVGNARRAITAGENTVAGLEQGLGDDQSLNNRAKQVAEQVIDEINKGLGNASPSKKTRQSGKFVVQGLLLGLGEGAGEVKSAGTSLGNALIESVESKLQINSPSLLFKQLGSYCAQGLMLGLETANSSGLTSALGIREFADNASAQLADARNRLRQERDALITNLRVDTNPEVRRLTGFVAGSRQNERRFSREITSAQRSGNTSEQVRYEDLLNSELADQARLLAELVQLRARLGAVSSRGDVFTPPGNSPVSAPIRNGVASGRVVGTNLGTGAATAVNSAAGVADTAIGAVEELAEAVAPPVRTGVESFFAAFNSGIREISQNNPRLAELIRTVGELGLVGLAGFGLAALAQPMFELGRASIETSMQLAVMRMNLDSFTNNKGAEILDKTREAAQKLGVEYISLAKAVTQIQAATINTSLEKQAPDLTLDLAQVVSARGLSESDQQRVFLAVTQIAAKGRLSLEELNQQLGEVLPGSLNLAAEAAGKSTAEFIKMVETGNVLSTDILPKLIGKLKEQSQSTANFNTVEKEMTRFKNAATALKESLGEMITPPVLGALSIFTKLLGQAGSDSKDASGGIGSISGNADILAKAIVIVGVAAVGTFASMVIGSSLATRGIVSLTTLVNLGLKPALMAIKSVFSTFLPLLGITLAIAAITELYNWSQKFGQSGLRQTNEGIAASARDIAIAYEEAAAAAAGLKTAPPKTDPAKPAKSENGMMRFSDSIDNAVVQSQEGVRNFFRGLIGKALPKPVDIAPAARKENQSAVENAKAVIKGSYNSLNQSGSNLFDQSKTEDYISDAAKLEERIKSLNSQLVVMQATSESVDQQKLVSLQKQIKAAQDDKSNLDTMFLPGGTSEIKKQIENLEKLKAELLVKQKEQNFTIPPFVMEGITAGIKSAEQQLLNFEAIQKRVVGQFKDIDLRSKKIDKIDSKANLQLDESYKSTQITNLLSGSRFEYRPEVAAVKSANAEKENYEKRIILLKDFVTRKEMLLGDLTKSEVESIEGLMEGVKIENATSADIDFALSIAKEQDLPTNVLSGLNAMKQAEDAGVKLQDTYISLAQSTKQAAEAQAALTRSLDVVATAFSVLNNQEEGRKFTVDIGFSVERTELKNQLAEGLVTQQEYELEVTEIQRKELQTRLNEIDTFHKTKLQILSKLDQGTRGQLEGFLGGKAEQASLTSIRNARTLAQRADKQKPISGEIFGSLDVLEAYRRDTLEAAQATEELADSAIAAGKQLAEYKKSLDEIRNALNLIKNAADGVSFDLDLDTTDLRTELKNKYAAGLLDETAYEKETTAIQKAELDQKLLDLNSFQEERAELLRKMSADTRNELEGLLGGKAESASMGDILQARTLVERQNRLNPTQVFSGEVSGALDTLEAFQQDLLSAAKLSEESADQAITLREKSIVKISYEQIEGIAKTFSDSLKGLDKSYKDYLKGITKQIKDISKETEQLLEKVDVLDFKNSLKRALMGETGISRQIGDLFSGVLEQLIDKDSEDLDDTSQMDGALEDAKEGLEGLKDQFSEALKTMGDAIKELGNQTIQGFIEVIKGIDSSAIVANAVGQFLNGANVQGIVGTPAKAQAAFRHTSQTASDSATSTYTPTVQTNNISTGFAQVSGEIDTSEYHQKHAQFTEDYAKFTQREDKDSEGYWQEVAKLKKAQADLHAMFSQLTLNTAQVSQQVQQSQSGEGFAEKKVYTSPFVKPDAGGALTYDFSQAETVQADLRAAYEKNTGAKKAVRSEEKESVIIDVVEQSKNLVKGFQNDLRNRVRDIEQRSDELTQLIDSYTPETLVKRQTQTTRDVNKSFTEYTRGTEDLQRELAEAMGSGVTKISELREKIAGRELDGGLKAEILTAYDEAISQGKSTQDTLQIIYAKAGELVLQAKSANDSATNFANSELMNEVEKEIGNTIADSSAGLLEAQAGKSGTDEYKAARLNGKAAEIRQLNDFAVQMQDTEKKLLSLGLAGTAEGDRIVAALTKVNEIKLDDIRDSADLLKTQLIDIGAGAFENFFKDVSEGAKSLGQSFADMGRSILSSLAGLLFKMAAMRLATTLLGGISIGGFADGGTVKGYSLGGTVVAGYADGGEILGGSRGYTFQGINAALEKEGYNSVLAALTPGEEVLSDKQGDASFYRYLDSQGLWDTMKAGGGKDVGNYALGGTVGSAGGQGGNNGGRSEMRRGGDTVNVTVYANDADSFKKSEGQMYRDLEYRQRRSASRNG